MRTLEGIGTLHLSAQILVPILLDDMRTLEGIGTLCPHVTSPPLLDTVR